MLHPLDVPSPSIIFTGDKWNKNNSSVGIDLARLMVYSWRRNNEHLYIGQTGSGRSRFVRFRWGHRIIGNKEPIRDTDIIEMWICKDFEQLDKLEKDLIQLYKPLYNKEFLNR